MLLCCMCCCWTNSALAPLLPLNSSLWSTLCALHVGLVLPGGLWWFVVNGPVVCDLKVFRYLSLLLEKSFKMNVWMTTWVRWETYLSSCLGIWVNRDFLSVCSVRVCSWTTSRLETRVTPMSACPQTQARVVGSWTVRHVCRQSWSEVFICSLKTSWGAIVLNICIIIQLNWLSPLPKPQVHREGQNDSIKHVCETLLSPGF